MSVTLMPPKVKWLRLTGLGFATSVVKQRAPIIHSLIGAVGSHGSRPFAFAIWHLTP